MTATTTRALSIEERVHALRRTLVLIEAAARAADEGEDTGLIDADDVCDAIAELAREAITVLDPIRTAPGEVLNWSPAADLKGGAR